MERFGAPVSTDCSILQCRTRSELSCCSVEGILRQAISWQYSRCRRSRAGELERNSHDSSAVMRTQLKSTLFKLPKEQDPSSGEIENEHEERQRDWIEHPFSSMKSSHGNLYWGLPSPRGRSRVSSSIPRVAAASSQQLIVSARTLRRTALLRYSEMTVHRRSWWLEWSITS